MYLLNAYNEITSYNDAYKVGKQHVYIVTNIQNYISTTRIVTSAI